MAIKIYGILAGTLLLFFAGLHSFLATGVILLQSLKTQTFDYFEMINKSLGKGAMLASRLCISLDYIACQIFGIVYFLDYFIKVLEKLNLSDNVIIKNDLLKYLCIFLFLLPLYMHKRMMNLTYLFYLIVISLFVLILLILVKTISLYFERRLPIL